MTDQALAKINKLIKEGRREDIQCVRIINDDLTSLREDIILALSNVPFDESESYEILEQMKNMESILYVCPISEKNGWYDTVIVFVRKHEENE